MNKDVDKMSERELRAEVRELREYVEIIKPMLMVSAEAIIAEQIAAGTFGDELE